MTFYCCRCYYQNLKELIIFIIIYVLTEYYLLSKNIDFMNKHTFDTKDVKKVFEDLKSNDPKIKINNTLINIIPNYWNYVFLLNFFPLLAAIYILTQQNDFKINFLCYSLIALSIYGIHSQLIFYNKILIDIQQKIIIITPNIIERIFTKPKTVLFNEIQNINFRSNGFGASHIRYVIVLKLKNTKQLKIISSSNSDYAAKMVKALLRII